MEQFFLRVSIMLVPALMAITCHEVSHGYIAYRFGDNTAKSLGRLTLNPLKHLDIIGTLMIFVIGIGWAKPVPIDYGNLPHPKRDMIWIAAAGPITNFALAVVSALVLRLLGLLEPGMAEGSLLTTFVHPLMLMLAFSVYINLILGIFNLIPVPPLDGGRVAIGLLPQGLSMALARLEPFGMIALLVLVLFTDIFGSVIFPMLGIIVPPLTGPHSSLVMQMSRLW